LKILFYRYGSICEPDIIETFHSLGYTVYENITEIYNKNPVLGTTIKEISYFIQQNPIDCIFSINFYPMLSEISQIYHIRYISWVVDAPVLELYTSSIQNNFNRTFIFDYSLYQDICSFNPEHIFYLPLAANISSKEKAIADAKNNLSKDCSAKLSFVGSLYTEKCPYDDIGVLSEYSMGYLESIMKVQENIYGYYFIEELLTENLITEIKHACSDYYTAPGSSFLSDKRLISQYYIGSKITSMERVNTMKILSQHFPTIIYTGSDTSSLPLLKNGGTAKTLTEMPVIFHSSAINLNMTSKAIRSGIPLRLWDILASGGFVLSNFQTELAEYFEFGSHLDVYGSKEELLEKCHYYFSHEKQRKEIAQNGLEEIKQKHTYDIRIENLFSIAFFS